jgi:hypothetical protein
LVIFFKKIILSFLKKEKKNIYKKKFFNFFRSFHPLDKFLKNRKCAQIISVAIFTFIHIDRKWLNLKSTVNAVLEMLHNLRPITRIHHRYKLRNFAIIYLGVQRVKKKNYDAFDVMK